jgi:hypothetical protein
MAAAGIGHRHLALHGVTGVGQLTTNPLLMGIQDPAEHEFAAGGDDLDVHGRHCDRGSGAVPSGKVTAASSRVAEPWPGRAQIGLVRRRVRD